MVLTEAISYGVIPLAFTSFNSINDIIKSPEQLIRSFNIKEYAEKLSQMMRNDVLRQKIRNKGYEIIQNYSANLICDKWESIIQTIIKEK